MAIASLLDPRGHRADVYVYPDAVRVTYPAGDGHLHVAAFTRDGQPIQNDDLQVTAIYPRIVGDYLAYQANPEVNTGQVTLRYLPTGAESQLGVARGSEPVALNPIAVAWQTDPADAIWQRLLTGSSPIPNGHGAPTGLATISLDGVVTTIDQARNSVPGLVNPVPLGPPNCWVGEWNGPQAYVGVILDGGPVRLLHGVDASGRELFANQTCDTPRGSFDGAVCGIVAYQGVGTRVWIGTRADLEALPFADAAVEVPTVPPATHQYDLFLYKDPRHLGPSTCFYDEGPGGVGGTVTHQDGSRLATVADSEGSQWTTPTGEVWLGIVPAVTYMTDPPADPAAEITRRITTAMRGHEQQPMVLILQFDSRVDGQLHPHWTDQQLAQLVFSYPGLVSQYPNVRLVGLFARDRAGGVQDHPWMVEFLRRWVAGIPTEAGLEQPVLMPTKDLSAPFSQPGQELDLIDSANPTLGTRVRVIHDPQKGLVVKLQYAATPEGSTRKTRPI